MGDKAKKVLDYLSTILLSCASVALVWQIVVGRRAGTPEPAFKDVSGLSLAAASMRHSRGSGDVVLVEFADFECPFCARHATTTAAILDEEFVKPGHLQMVFYNFPLAMHIHAEKASEAVECAADQGRFWEMHKRLFERPLELDTPGLVSNAKAIGLDQTSFVACLQGDETAAKVKTDLEEGRRLSVSSTPSFFLGRRDVDGEVRLLRRTSGAAPIEEFRKEIAGMSRSAGLLGAGAKGAL